MPLLMNRKGTLFILILENKIYLFINSINSQKNLIHDLQNINYRLCLLSFRISLIKGFP